MKKTKRVAAGKQAKIPSPTLTKGQKISRGIKTKQMEALCHTPDILRGKSSPAKTNAPDELSGIWTPELTTAWNKLDEKQRSFVKEWYSNGFHGTKAYAYAYKITNDDVARANASRLLAHANVFAIREAIQKTLKAPLERIHQVYLDAMSAETPIFAGDSHIGDTPDHKSRMAGADRMSKIHNLEKPAEAKITHAGKIDLVIDISILADILNGHSSE